jgi:ferredoxin-NADP reductase
MSFQPGDHMADYTITLKHREEVAEETMAFRFDIAGTGYTFKAGQNAEFTLLNPPETDIAGNIRTLSFASSPNDLSSLMVAMRMRKSAFKNSLRALPLGSKLRLSSAIGSFRLHMDGSKPAVFLVGGIGITPVLSILAHAAELALPHQIYVFYSNSDPRKVAFLDELQRLEKTNPALTFIPTVTTPNGCVWPFEHGRIDAPMLARYLPDVHKPVYYVCGPPKMVTAMQKLLYGLGVNEDNLRSEEFGGY